MKTTLLMIPIIALIGCAGSSGVSAPEAETPTIVREIEVDATDAAVPGTVYEEWEEPMYDMVHQPAQLDPAKNYYRAQHRTVVEIRPGRTQTMRYPEQ